MSEAITKAQTLENIISISNMHADDAAWLRAALSQPAPLATPKATLMTEHRDYIDGYTAGLADGQRLAPLAGEVTDEQREKVMDAIAEALGDAYDCTRVWEAWSVGTMSQDDFSVVRDDQSRLAEIADAAILALRPQAVPAEGVSDFFVLDDQAKAMIVNSHHYTPDSIKALIERLKAFSDPEKTTQSDWDNLDWRGFCNVLCRVMMGLACNLSPQAVPMTPEQMRKAAMDEMNKIPALANHHAWKGWPGTWAFATAAVNGITAKAEGGVRCSKNC